MKPPKFFKGINCVLSETASLGGQWKISHPKTPLFSKQNAPIAPFSAKQADFPHLGCGNSASSAYSLHTGHYSTGGKHLSSDFHPRLFPAGLILALSLLMALVLGTDDHHFAVSLDDLALIAHRFYGRSDFHEKFLLVPERSGGNHCAFGQDLLRQVMRPLVRS